MLRSFSHAPNILPYLKLRAIYPDTLPNILPQLNGGDDGIMSIPGAEDQIDPATFEQILEMDDDEEEREFSKSIVYDFFGQADSTFAKMDKSL